VTRDRNWKSRIDFGSNIEVIEKTAEKIVLQMQDDSGDGAMTQYEVLPGIVLMYNDFHMDYCRSEFSSDLAIININYCTKGRIEWVLPGERFMYIREGDLQIENRRSRAEHFSFPSSHYHGLTVGVLETDLPIETRGFLDKFGIDLKKLTMQYSGDENMLAYRPSERVERIFEELYVTSWEQSVYYLRIKVLELLMELQEMDLKERDKTVYFRRSHVEAVKEIARLITGNLNKHYTIASLSELYHLPPTTLKICFKGVFGMPVGQYLREYRMETAAKMLQKNTESISEIAGKVGYDNQSKFAAAFRVHKGVSPTEYRKVAV